MGRAAPGRGGVGGGDPSGAGHIYVHAVVRVRGSVWWRVCVCVCPLVMFNTKRTVSPLIFLTRSPPIVPSTLVPFIRPVIGLG
jgi:hypothetical protein